MIPRISLISLWSLVFILLHSIDVRVNAEQKAHALSKADMQNETLEVHVYAGPFNRENSVVSFAFPVDLEEGIYLMSDPNDESVIVQVDHDNTGWFVLENLSAGESIEYVIYLDKKSKDEFKTPSKLGVSHELEEQTVTFVSHENPVLSYFHRFNSPPETLDNRYRRGGYIHPVYSPSGVILSNHLNVEQHPHHSGIWSAWTNTEFDDRTPDFWNVHNNTGRVDVDTLLNLWSGPVHAGFNSLHRFIDMSKKDDPKIIPEDPMVALHEKWDVRVFGLVEAAAANAKKNDTESLDNDLKHDFLMFDLEVTQTTNNDNPLLLPEYHYGGVGFRGHYEWDNPDNVTFLTSEGLGRDGNETRPRWVHIGGKIDNKQVGIAILGHPSNYRFPQPVRIHPEEPFFNYAPTQLGEMSIQPGEPYVAKYRYVTYDGELPPSLIERLWQDYAYPPAVNVTR
ncbi:PmoA family protein [Natronogracilivirga saccharolytica]|uniref:PmoA family protein n=1 Tax=Natronogracilivirga saccharolytica TaxID=2812953 RepID=A0A8J7RU57_9BACT|nr:PmoA family protein [Natronogracilivirga saccharolytica]MBP3193964.1 PmoA family protein [Natronogracilivirga saccharolytica]